MSKRAYTTKAIRRPSRKCLNCGKSGHTKSSCPKLTKRKERRRKTNYVEEDSFSSETSETSESSEISESDDDMHVCYGLKKKNIKKSTRKENKKKKEKKETNKKKKKEDKISIVYIYLMLIFIFKQMVEAFVKLFPEDTVVKAYKMIEGEFIKLKEPTFTIMEQVHPSIEQREEIWKEVAYHTGEILRPMYEIVNKTMATNLNKKEEIKEEIMEESIANIISGLGRRSASDIAKIKSR